MNSYEIYLKKTEQTELYIMKKQREFNFCQNKTSVK
jgi:hypothetical protein